MLTVTQRAAGGDLVKWTLAGSQPGIGRISIGGRVYTLDGAGNLPVAWTCPEPGVLRGTGTIPDASVGFTLNLLLRPGSQLTCQMLLTVAGATRADWLGFPPTPVATSPRDRLVFPQRLGLLILQNCPLA